jgi:transcription antitermination protein NusB
MLNRRTLRIKIMQSLFAFEQCKEANYQLALDFILAEFQPDLNSMEVQDKDLLKKQRKEGTQYFEKKFLQQDTPPPEDARVNKVVDQALANYHQQVQKDQQFLARNLITEIQKLTTLYHTVLRLLVSLGDAAGAVKRGSHTNFVKSEVLLSISQDEKLKKEWSKSAETNVDADRVRTWFRDVVKEDADYQKFIDSKNPTIDQQQNILRHIVRRIILGKTVINDYFEEKDLRWMEDREIIKSLVEKTIKSFADGKITEQKVSIDWEDDQQFIEKLFKQTATLEAEYKDLIAQNTKNWEVDRLPLTDRVILEMAISEMVFFQNIPVKVTINEYIELTKEYSTPKSRQFINGILDVIAKLLANQGKIKKSGRGLIDNK